MSGDIPESVFVMLQMTFAVITPALIVGGFAERMRFSSMLTFSALWLLVVYAPITHWVWGGGFLGEAGVLDFAGGAVGTRRTWGTMAQAGPRVQAGHGQRQHQLQDLRINLITLKLINLNRNNLFLLQKNILNLKLHSLKDLIKKTGILAQRTLN